MSEAVARDFISVCCPSKMKGRSNMKVAVTGIFVSILLSSFAISTVIAQDKAKAQKSMTEPAKDTKAQSANVLFENERIRVVETRIKPGEKNEMKMRSDRVNISIKPAKLRVHYPDGKKEDFDLKAGGVRYNKSGTSSTENIGKTESHTVIVNLK